MGLALASTSTGMVDVPVLHRHTIRPGTPEEKLSSFGDMVWHLDPAHPDAHVKIAAIYWRNWPAELVADFKRVVLAILTEPTPRTVTVTSGGELMGIGTLSFRLQTLRVLAAWMSQQHLISLHQVTDQQLDRYRQHVLGLEASNRRKRDLFIGVLAVWSYRDRLPSHCRIGSATTPWDGATPAQMANAPARAAGQENTTPRISSATMEALLSWSIRMVDTIGPDIVAARDELDRYETGTHSDQDGYHGLSSRQRVTRFAALTAEQGHALPGQLGHDGQTAINWAQIAVRLHLPSRQIQPYLRDPILDRDLPVATGSFVGTITGRIDDHPWRRQPITTQELPALMKSLSAACFVVISYLSGMRPGETLNLRRGCASQQPDTGQLIVTGRYGKGHARAPHPGDDEHDPWARAWVVVRPVHQAIEILERLSDSPFLFPASLTCAHTRRPADRNARRSSEMTHDLQRFIDWVNTIFARADGKPLIPPDPNGRIYPSRFRRTLAYFIVRRPRGLIAAALQYGHVSTTVTLSYSGKADTGWQDDVAVERLEAILEQNEHDHALLNAGERVSGPAAIAYQDRTEQTRRFAGRAVNRVRNVERLLAQVDPNIHHGDAMTCVYQAETAACRTTRINQGLPADNRPVEAECQSGCVNLAYTDRDIQQLHERAAALDATAADPLSPAPLRDRARSQAEQSRRVIARHETSTMTDNTP